MKRVKKIFIDDSGDQPRLVFYTNDNKEYEAKRFLQGFYIEEVNNEPISWEERLENMTLSEVEISDNKIVQIYTENE